MARHTNTPDCHWCDEDGVGEYRRDGHAICGPCDDYLAGQEARDALEVAAERYWDAQFDDWKERQRDHD